MSGGLWSSAAPGHSPVNSTVWLPPQREEEVVVQNMSDHSLGHRSRVPQVPSNTTRQWFHTGFIVIKQMKNKGILKYIGENISCSPMWATGTQEKLCGSLRCHRMVFIVLWLVETKDLFLHYKRICQTVKASKSNSGGHT